MDDLERHLRSGGLAAKDLEAWQDGVLSLLEKVRLRESEFSQILGDLQAQRSEMTNGENRQRNADTTKMGVEALQCNLLHLEERIQQLQQYVGELWISLFLRII